MSCKPLKRITKDIQNICLVINIFKNIIVQMHMNLVTTLR